MITGVERPGEQAEHHQRRSVDDGVGRLPGLVDDGIDIVAVDRDPDVLVVVVDSHAERLETVEVSDIEGLVGGGDRPARRGAATRPTGRDAARCGQGTGPTA